MIYPDSWLVSGEGTDITLAPRDGVAQGGVGFGVVMGVFTPQKGRAGLGAATDDLIKKLQEENPKMRVTSAARTTTVGGADGMSAMLAEESPFSGGETDHLVAVMRPNGLLYFVFVAPDADYSRVEKTFQQMLGSVALQ